MPLIGTDFSPTQRQALRVMADAISPGLTDAQVLAWATEQGVKASLRAAFDLYVKEITDQTNQTRRDALAPVEAVINPTIAEGGTQ